MTIVTRDNSKRKTTFLRVLRVKSAATFSVLALVLSIFVVMLPFAAASAEGSPATPATVEILSPYEIIEPSSQPNDKDGYPPQTSEADVEECIIQGKIVVTDTIYNPVATLVDDDADAVDDLTIDDDNPRDLDMLDGNDDDQLAPGTYYIFWNLDKTGYVPVDTPHGAAYNGSNSASISVVGDIEKYTIELSYESDTVTSPVFTIEMEKSASIKQNDLDWMATAPQKIEAGIGDVFTVRTKYHQNSANGMKHLISQVYFNGLAIRLLDLDIYYYNNYEPGDIEDGVPEGWEVAYYSKMELTPTELVDTDNKDFWVMEYTFEVVDVLYSFVIPYTQTIKKGNSWKVDTGYEGFQSEVPEGVNPANLTIDKYFSTSYPDGVVSGPNPPEVGQTTVFELTIEVMNIGGDDAVDVIVTDTIPIEKVTWENVYTASQGTVTYDSGTGDLTWYVGTLGLNESATLSFQVSVTPILEDVGNTILLNSGAYVTGTSKTSEEPVEDGPTPPLETEPVIGPPDMNVYKTADKSTAIPGDQITYTITYENVGYGDAYSVVIQDTIPAETTYVSSNPGYDSVSGNTYTWNIGTVAAGATGSVTITVVVNTGTADGTVLTNNVILDYEDMGGDPQPQESDSVDVTVYTPIMTVSKTADFDTYDPGDEIIYTITYTNTGGADAYNVVIEDTIPAETTYVSSSPTYDSVLDDTYTWNIGNVAAGGSGTITLVVEVDAGTPDQTELTNYVTLDYTDANDNPYPPQSDSVTVTVTAPSMTITKTADKTTANPGDLITYTIYYENTGTGDATGVTIEDTIPMYTTYVSSDPLYDSVLNSIYTWNIGTVPGGASGTITLVVEVDEGTPDQTILTNSVIVYYDDANENPMPPDEDDEDVVVTAPVMTFEKSVDLAYANPGDTLTYTLYYENTGTGDAANVVVEDTIPAETTFVSSTPMYSSVTDDTYTFNIGDVAAGASGTITITVTVDAYTPDQTVLTNYATLDYTDVNGNAYDQLDDSAETTVTAPDKTLSKTADKEYANPGDQITYTIDYENLGSGIATDVVIVDTIDPDTTYISASPTPSSIVDDVITWNIGTVAGYGSGSITLIVEVDAYVVDGTVLTNAVTLNYDDANGNPYPEESDTADVTVTAPDMIVSKNADKVTANPGDQVTYTIEYENLGSGDATNVVIVDTIDPDTTYISASPSPSSVVDDVITWDIGTVVGYGSGSITLIVEVDAYVADGTVLTNGVTLNYDDANGNPQTDESDTAEVTVTAPDMIVSKVADKTTANPGDQITYTIEYENLGSGDATNVVIVDTIDPDTTYVSASPTPSSVVDDVITWNIGTVAGYGSGSITLVVEVDAYVEDGTVLTNGVTLNYDDTNGNPYTEESDTADVTVTAPDMTISKTASTSTANPGDTITYTIYYENVGTGDAANVVIEDQLSGYETLVGTDPMYTSYIGNMITWELGTVAGGASGTITVEVTVNAGTPDDTIVTNTVTLDYTDVNGNAYPQESDSASVEVTAPIMTFTKTVDKDVTYKGDTLTYTLTYENTGDGEATGVTIVDYLPTNTIYLSAIPTPSTVNGQTLTWDIASVPGNSGPLTITIQVEVGSGAVDNEVLHNVATLDYDDANGNAYPQLSDYADSTVLHGSICGTVFNDMDFNGYWDAGEPGIPGVTITLSTGETTVTDENGYYSFPELPPGTYTVTETNLPGWSSTTPDIVEVTLGLDEDAIVNFGDSQASGKITGTVWNDVDHDGIWDANENGIWGVTVSVYDSSNNLVATTTTDYDGNYIFDSLAPGDYTVVETNLQGWISTTPDTVTISLDSEEEEIVNFGDYYPYPPSAPSYAVSIGMTGGGKIEIQVGETATLNFSASNSGDVGSKLRFITFTAAIYDNTVIQFIAPYTGHYEVYLHDGTLAWSGDVDGTFTQEKHGNFDKTGNTLYDMVTWTLSEEAYLEGGGEVKFSFQVIGVNTGSSKLQFFPRSTEDHHSSGVPLSQIADKKNLWNDESTGLWYPAHNSYDPWDDDINSGHVWRQWSWDPRITNKSYSKAKAEIIVKP